MLLGRSTPILIEEKEMKVLIRMTQIGRSRLSLVVLMIKIELFTL
jgi:hypothetical protein